MRKIRWFIRWSSWFWTESKSYMSYDRPGARLKLNYWRRFPGAYLYFMRAMYADEQDKRQMNRDYPELNYGE